MTEHDVVLVPARAATDADIDRVGTRTTRTLLKAAEAAGWTHRATFAAGYHHKRPDVLEESVVVRLVNHPFRGVAWWRLGEFVGAYAWTPISAPTPIGIADLTKFVKANPVEGTAP